MATSPSRRKRRRKEGERERKMERKIRENREITNFPGRRFFHSNKLDQVGSSQQVEKGSRGGRGVGGGEGEGERDHYARVASSKNEKFFPSPVFLSRIEHTRAHAHTRAHIHTHIPYIPPLPNLYLLYLSVYNVLSLFFLLHRRIAGRLSCRYNIPRKNFPSSLCTKTP